MSTYAASITIDAFPSFRRVVRDVLQQSFHDRVEAPRADVLLPLVDRERDLGEPRDAVGPEVEMDLLGVEQRLVLADETGVGGGQDLLEIGDRQRGQLDADREPALQLGDEIGGLREVERARRDEQDVVGAHHPVLGRHGGALDQRQEVALHALARDVGSLHFLAARDLVDLVEEHDAVLLDVGERPRLDLVVGQELGRFLVGEHLQRLGDTHLGDLAPAARELREHALQLAVRSSMPGGAMISICGGVSETSSSTSRSSSLPSRSILRNFCRAAESVGCMSWKFTSRAGGSSTSRIALLGRVGGAVAHLARLGFARLLDRDVDQIADDRVDVAADVAHLGELGRLDLDERRVGEPREPARDFGLADAGRPDHQDVLRRDLLPQRLGHLLPPPAVAQRDGDGALGGVLPDDVLVELGDDLGGSHVGHGGPAAKKNGRPSRTAVVFYPGPTAPSPRALSRRERVTARAARASDQSGIVTTLFENVIWSAARRRGGDRRHVRLRDRRRRAGCTAARRRAHDLRRRQRRCPA